MERGKKERGKEDICGQLWFWYRVTIKNKDSLNTDFNLEFCILDVVKKHIFTQAKRYLQEITGKMGNDIFKIQERLRKDFNEQGFGRYPQLLPPVNMSTQSLRVAAFFKTAKYFKGKNKEKTVMHTLQSLCLLHSSTLWL